MMILLFRKYNKMLSFGNKYLLGKMILCWNYNFIPLYLLVGRTKGTKIILMKTLCNIAPTIKIVHRKYYAICLVKKILPYIDIFTTRIEEINGLFFFSS